MWRHAVARRVLVDVNHALKKEDKMDGFATNVLKNARICFLGVKCRECANNEIEAEEVDYCIASGFARIRQKNTQRT
jgi:ribosomal protein S27E